ncbi:hypothetical protein GRF29_103g189281 [Pseudopithomyces chartarum]|uniref:BTB domain-containing protein n=1 Tax=Pseudopithomyces chartarum TaxID=1892770 RepID=A0AAN6LTE1_9PLEO|nr:hypothetical protein GRF29_103g189281 [Pseudopithomyces chartarum]
MDSSAENNFPLAWCTLAPPEVTKRKLETFTILVGPPDAPSKFEYPQTLVKRRSEYFRTMFKTANDEIRPKPWIEKKGNLRSPKERFDEPEACFREANDHIVDFTATNPTLILDYFFILQKGVGRARKRWTTDAHGLDTAFGLFLLGDYFMDPGMMNTMILEMRRIAGLVTQENSWGACACSLLGNGPAAVPSVDFIWYVYNSVSSYRYSESFQAREFLSGYFTAFGTVLPDLSVDLPEGFEQDLMPWLQFALSCLEWGYFERWPEKIYGKSVWKVKLLPSGLEREEGWEGPKIGEQWEGPEGPEVAEDCLRAAFKFRKEWEELINKVEDVLGAYPEMKNSDFVWYRRLRQPSTWEDETETAGFIEESS